MSQVMYLESNPNSCFKIMYKLVSSCHITKIIFSDYGFKLLKKVKIIVINHCFNIKLKLWYVLTLFF